MHSLDPDYRLLAVGEFLLDGDEAWSTSADRWVEVREFYGLSCSTGAVSVNGLGLVQKAQGRGAIHRRKLDVITKLGRLSCEVSAVDQLAELADE